MPVVSDVARSTAPLGKTMGHAGATARRLLPARPEARKDALEAMGTRVGTTPTEAAQLVAELARA